MPTAAGDRLGRFLDAIDPFASRSEAEPLVRQLLGVADLRALPCGLSVLNNDGSPLELCVTLRRGASKARFVADPAFDSLGAEERFARSSAAIDGVFARAGASALAALAHATLCETTAGVPRSAFTNGAIWLAAGVGERGAAIYVDARPHGNDGGWETARRWLVSLLADPADALRTIDSLAGVAEAASYSIEGTSPDDARAKIYFRMRESLPLTRWGSPLFADPRVVRFLSLALKDASISGEGMVASAGFHMSGARADIKLDLCGHCLDQTPQSWSRLIDACASDLGLAAPRFDEVLENSSVAFIGLGLATAGEPRLNVYLRPLAANGRVDSALALGIQYLMSIQSGDGSWWDYALPVGASDQWVTAYVGYALATAGECWPDARRAALRAAQWLLEHRTFPAGWGFNEMSGPDADSTAFAIALMRRLALPVEQRDQELVAEHLRADGGISTYRTDDAWGIGHPDVTPLAFEALPDAIQQRRHADVRDFLSRSRLASGEWPSYWWRNNSYASFAVASGSGEPVVIDEARIDRTNTFDIACALGASRSDALETLLLSLQRPDGAWPGGPNLRVTAPECETPWVKADGEYYDDFRCTITTATALRALAGERGAAGVRPLPFRLITP